MIYGAYNTKNTELDFSFLKKIRKNLSFPQGIHYSFDYKSFVGGFFINPIFPKGKKDFFYCSTSKDIVVIKAGTIFNSNELSNYFLKEDQLSEPEFIAKSFLKFGVNFLNDLNGDFIIVIFSPIKNELLIARDQVGIQPLAYTIKNNEFLFSSDEMALCKSLYNEDIIDSEWLLSPFKLMDPKVSVNPNVKKLTPGNFLKISKKEFIDKPYWFPENISENKKLTFPDVIKDLNLLVEDAVKIRSDQRYFAGTHLSGGLDSGIIAILSKKYSSHQKKFFAFSYAPKNHSQQRSSFDERILVKEIADQNKMNLIFTDFENDDLLNFIKNYYENLGGIWEEKIRKNAQKLKVNLIFSGWGGDQFLSIGNSGINFDLFWGLNWILFFKLNPVHKIRKLLSTLLYDIFFPFFNIKILPSRKELNLRKKYIKKEYRKDNPEFLKRIFLEGSRKTQHINSLRSYIISERCDNWSVQGFKQGIEYRYPLLDIRIIEYILQIPSKVLVKYPVTRILIRNILKGVFPEKARTENSKLDYVLNESFLKILKESSNVFIDEIGDWENNSDLSFINFSALKKDALKLNSEKDERKKYNLMQSIYFFKMLHEFTKTYRSLPPESE